MTLADAASRARAIEPTESCIVQAPAGSGKTTLLVNRYLRLLSGAKHPEQLLAITFTRKAAAEMRLRVLDALHTPNSEDAEKVLALDRSLGWQLLANPNRLKIQTIDSFAMALTRQLPLASGFDRDAQLIEDASDFYQRAAHRLFASLYSDHDLGWALAKFLSVIDNDVQKAGRLLGTMLARRDQWLDAMTEVLHVYQRQPDQVTAILNRGVAKLVDAVGKDIRSRLTDELQRELDWLVTFANDHLDAPAGFWATASRVCTNQRGRLRKQLTVREGFPPECRSEKARALDFINALRERHLENRFASLGVLPEDQLAGASGADELVAICITLSLAVMELSTLFRTERVADFTELILAARRALRTGDQPTELALAIDYRIRHILIDEFQDTSIAQFQLLELLTQGWAGEQDVSFFAVGDPMQSIYRFRDADVGLFYRARDRGIDQVPLTPLTLSSNFRATPELVDWVNATFAGMMGDELDALIGKVPYSPSTAVERTAGGADIALYARETDELAAVVAEIKRLIAYTPNQRIALLVRSRSHLALLLRALRDEQIAWQATDIDALIDTPVVTDLLTLTTALAQSANRLAWLSLLRAPWVGLSLAGLQSLSQLASFNPDSLTNLSDQLAFDDQTRLAKLVGALRSWLPRLYEVPPRTVIESVWLLCGGPAAYAEPQALDHAERFFELVDELGPDGLDAERLKLRATNLFAEDLEPARLQILTIHKAKGLEFDHVMLPFLHRETRSSDAPLVRWRLQDDELLVAAKGSGNLYDWLAGEARQHEQHELQRLLYVACTRAKQTLYLSATVTNNPPKGSLLHLLWPQICDLPQAPANPSAHHQPRLFDSRLLYRLPSEFVWRPPARTPVDHDLAHVVFAPKDGDRLGGRLEVALGNLVHAALCHLGRRGLPADPEFWVQEQRDRWAANLSAAGLSNDQVEAALRETRRQIIGVIGDERGRWLLGPRKDAQSELGVTGLVDGVLDNAFFDRTFEYEDVRWIIDFKTGQPGSSTAFVADEIARYRPQLSRYRSLASDLYDKPVRTALYLTAMPKFVVVDA